MKILLNLFLFAIILASCTSVKQIGKINMISNRNVDPNLNYRALSTYSGGSISELERTQAKSIEDAIDQTVRKVPGGEFLMNAKIYIVNDEYFAVEGDVWGSPSQVSFRGFKLGDKVTWYSLGNYRTGIISALKDDKSCLVRVDNEPNNMVEMPYDKIAKMGNDLIKEKIDSTSSSTNSKSAGFCFIATACYGDYDAHEVKILRQYRDSVLLKSYFGKRMVDVYYFLSPPFAKFLEKSEPAKAFVRKYILAPIIVTIKQNQ